MGLSTPREGCLLINGASRSDALEQVAPRAGTLAQARQSRLKSQSIGVLTERGAPPATATDPLHQPFSPSSGVQKMLWPHSLAS